MSAKSLPLNSLRLTAPIASRIAKELGATGSAFLEDLRQNVEGQVEELGHSPIDIQSHGVLAEQHSGSLNQRWNKDRGAGEGSYGEAGGGYGTRDTVVLGMDRKPELEAEMSRLTATLHREVKEKVEGEKSSVVTDKEADLETLKSRIAVIKAGGSGPAPRDRPPMFVLHPRSAYVSTSRFNQGPSPQESTTRESLDMLFDDWLPMLQRTATWNQWGKEETLLEWNLLGESDNQVCSESHA